MKKKIEKLFKLKKNPANFVFFLPKRRKIRVIYFLVYTFVINNVGFRIEIRNLIIKWNNSGIRFPLFAFVARINIEIKWRPIDVQSCLNFFINFHFSFLKNSKLKTKSKMKNDPNKIQNIIQNTFISIYRKNISIYR